MTRRADGLYMRQMRYADPLTGEAKRTSFYGRTQAEVLAKLKDAEERLAEGAPVRDSSSSVAQWASVWRETALSASNRKDTTKSLYRSLSRTHIESGRLGSVPLNRLKPSDIDAFLLQLQDSGKSSGTVARVFHVLRAILDDAVRDGLTARNAARKVKQPAVVKPEIRLLSPSEVSNLLRCAEGTRAHRLLAVIAALGLRKGEATCTAVVRR